MDDAAISLGFFFVLLFLYAVVVFCLDCTTIEYLCKGCGIAAEAMPFEHCDLLHGLGRVYPDTGIPASSGKDLAIRANLKALLTGMLRLDDLEWFELCSPDALGCWKRMLGDDGVCCRGYVAIRARRYCDRED